MELFKIENLTFKYPKRSEYALKNINISINKGDFLTICGKSGCGKSTLLRSLKSCLKPHGEKTGNIYFDGINLDSVVNEVQSRKIGFVMQNVENQIVTDKVWHELAFGLESIGVKTNEIRVRVAEMASFFGIQTWFYKNVSELSGGQKQLLNLASVMVMQPDVLILDEPTSMLDPLSALDFLETLNRINKELGTTIILSEHRLEEAFPISDKILVMDSGEVIAFDTPEKVGEKLFEEKSDMFLALPTPVRVFYLLDEMGTCPITVNYGKIFLEKYSLTHKIKEIGKSDNEELNQNIIIEVRNAWFRYEKQLPDVVRGLNTKIYKGEFYVIVGGNGTGKSTAIGLIGGILTPYRGKVLISGNKPHDVKIGILPQDPQTLFVRKTVRLDLMDVLIDEKISKEQKEQYLQEISRLCEIENLLNFHPYDLSGGEQQRVALAKILMVKPEIILLDEPTKGFDAHFKESFSDILRGLKENGITIVMVSHDIEFCAKNADRCAMFFDGQIVSEGKPREFFAGKSFYTTAANRMSRGVIKNAILCEDVVEAFGGKIVKREHPLKKINIIKEEKLVTKKPKRSIKSRLIGSLSLILFAVTTMYFYDKTSQWQKILYGFLSISELGITLYSFLPKKKLIIDDIYYKTNNCEMRLDIRTKKAAFFIMLLIPLTIFIGVFYLDDRKYLFISLLIIIETFIPFAYFYEKKKPDAREIVVVSVLCAIAVAGRGAFFMLPHFKPIAAIVIISGVCFGGETGFLVGAMSAFVSNMFFGQGPWTPWQMFAFGIIGFLAGVLFKKGFLLRTRGALCIFGALSVLLIYGGIMNPAAVFMANTKPTLSLIYAAYLSGIPVDLVHSFSTVFFLWFISPPMFEKLDRIKIKYGI